jgi:hypothetical protein
MTQEGADREGLLFVVLFSIIYFMKASPGYPSHVLNDEDYAFQMLRFPAKNPPILCGGLLFFQTLLLFHILSSSLRLFANPLDSLYSLPLFVHITTL